MAPRNISRFFQHPLNCALFRCYPPLVSRAYIRLMGGLFFRRYPAARERYVDPMKRTLASSPAFAGDLEKTSRLMIKGVVDHYFEKLLNAYWGYERMRRMLRRRVKLVHRDLLDSAMREGRGVILTTAHFGALEYLPATLAFNGYPVTMTIGFKTEKMRDTISSLAAKAAIDLVDVNQGNVLPQALKALRGGRIFVFELDELKLWRPNDGKVMRFFGRRVRLDRAMEVVQRRTGAPILLGLMERTGIRSYQLIFERPSEHFPAPTRLGPDAQLLKRLEHYIYMLPEQWYLWKDLALIDRFAA